MANVVIGAEDAEKLGNLSERLKGKKPNRVLFDDFDKCVKLLGLYRPGSVIIHKQMDFTIKAYVEIILIFV